MEGRLLLLIAAFSGLSPALLLCLGFGLFFRFVCLCGLFGLCFGVLLALFVENSLAAEEFDEGLDSAIALIPTGADDAGITALTVAESGTNGIEQFIDGSAG